MSAPDLYAVKVYLDSQTGDASSWTDDDIQDALDAEKAAQAARCRVPSDVATWPADLAEALYRRVARNLALRGLPLGFVPTLGGGEDFLTNTRVGWDVEIARLEGPHRRLVVG